MKKDTAKRTWQRMYGKHGYKGWLFQFPKGHWGYAIDRSPVAESLKESDFIYPGIVAKQKIRMA